ncbi:membrane protein insertase YidC [Acinetobacter gandensis]|uniref:Membrane protein insertase YidC n=1 Tax=Acinetobacter gandensis TaxID=1443941 RepID=A0A1A7RH14_9GAMM|nr:membrane protein insertase YidC [Acinetobacter gandensis]KAB0624519.1 membrane protein insertase YidC [Acinetobacter gandensis]OBX29927.1 membrane protein insertase YidC [Acinetobacter gandensis]
MQQWARIAILGAMFVVAYLLILAWQKDYGNAEQKPQQNAAVVSHEVSADLPNGQTATAASDVPQANNAATQQTTDATAPVSQQLISVQTDLYHFWISPKGGDIVRVELLNHDKNKDSDEPFVMLESDAKRTYVAQSGLIGLNGPDSNPKGRPSYEIEKSSYTMNDAKAVKAKDGQTAKVLSVPMVYKTADGVEVIKTFSFTEGKYPVVVNHKIVNRSAQNWQGQMFGQLKRDNSEDPGKSDQGIFTLGTFLGGAWGSPDEHYNKLKFANFNEEKLNVEATGGWVAMVQHYFVSAWVPGEIKLTQNGQPYAAKLESRKSTDDMNIIGFTSPAINVPAGTVAEVDATFYSGPKIQSELKDLAVGLNQTVDYGWLWPIAKLLFLGLQFFHGLVGNWGWAIILLTILVKLILWPLSSKSYRSMAKMRVIAPEMQRMKEEFGEDRMRFSQEMMALYKREQVNPLAGCLPLLLQMPIFLALYWVLMESVELRHAPWLLWIQDLSAMDPWFILPLLMGATMFIQQMLNPQPADPMQAKVFRIMPIIFTVFMLFFPAGLVLYWIVNNSITILQQGMINKSVEKERAKRDEATPVN